MVESTDSVKDNSLNEYQQGNRWKRGILPKCILSIKGRSCNQTPLVN